MARHKKMRPPEEDEPGLDISSLIDVCFLLLIYFLVTTQIIRKELELSTTLPSTTPSTTPPELSPLFIRVEGDGNISIKDEANNIELIETNPDSRDLENLHQRIVAYKAAAVGTEPLVQIQVEPEAVQQRVIDVLNALNRVKIKQITFTDTPDPDA